MVMKMNKQKHLGKETLKNINEEIDIDVNKYLITSNDVKFMYYFLDTIIIMCSVILLVFFMFFLKLLCEYTHTT